jgi:hypothetical protein
MRIGRLLLAAGFAAAAATTPADAGGARQSQNPEITTHDYTPVRVTVTPSPAHPRSEIRVSFKAPFDLQPGDIWVATFTTCARTTGTRFKGLTDRSQFVNAKPFTGGETTGSTASVRLKPRDIDLGPKKHRDRWCRGTAVLAIEEANPNDSKRVSGIKEPQPAIEEWLQLRGGIGVPGLEHVMKRVPVRS